MKSIFIDRKYFMLGSPESKGLLKALQLVADSGYKLYTNYELDQRLSEILKNENIHFELSAGNEKEFDYSISTNANSQALVNGNVSQYSNILELVTSIFSKDRVAQHKRSTKETIISLEINLDGSGRSEINTGIGFFDHMLDQIARHGNIDLSLSVQGDLHVDEHHTVEDVGIAVGEAINKALGEKKGIKRYGYFLPMDDTIAKVGLDLGGRQYLNFNCKFNREKVGEFPTELTEEFFKGISQGLKANVYVKSKGKNDHHKIEAIFKAFAKSLNEACRIDERAKGKLPTTKGVI